MDYIDVLLDVDISLDMAICYPFLRVTIVNN
jgi:hypothetical protein